MPGGTRVGQWYQLEITALGPTTTVKLDGTRVIHATDENSPLLNGGLRLFVGGGAGPAMVDIDDVVVHAIP